MLTSRFPLVRVVSTSDGGTQFVDDAVPLTDGGDVGRLSEVSAAGTVAFRETDDTYDWALHTAPARQLILLLDGQIEVTVAGDGARETRVFSGGDVLLVEDVSGRGHATRQLSKGVRRSVFVTLPDGVLMRRATGQS